MSVCRVPVPLHAASDAVTKWTCHGQGFNHTLALPAAALVFHKRFKTRKKLLLTTSFVPWTEARAEACRKHVRQVQGQRSDEVFAPAAVRMLLGYAGVWAKGRAGMRGLCHACGCRWLASPSIDPCSRHGRVAAPSRRARGLGATLKLRTQARPSWISAVACRHARAILTTCLQTRDRLSPTSCASSRGTCAALAPVRKS